MDDHLIVDAGEFISGLLHQIKVSDLKMPILCEADDQTHMAFTDGALAMKRAIVEAFAAKLLMYPKPFDAQKFIANCYWEP